MFKTVHNEDKWYKTAESGKLELELALPFLIAKVTIIYKIISVKNAESTLTNKTLRTK